MSTMTVHRISKKKLKQNVETYYSLHKEKYKEKNKKYAQEHKEQLKAYREKNKEKIREHDRIYKQKNRAKILKKQAEYQKNKREFTKFIRPLYDLESRQGETFTNFYNRMKQEQADKEKENQISEERNNDCV